MRNIPNVMLAEARQLWKAIKSLRRKHVIDSLVRRGIAPDRIEQTIRDAEVAANVMTITARSRIAHRKRAKLRVVK